MTEKKRNLFRDLAQPGRALALGARCRRFESYSPDQKKRLYASFFDIWDLGFEPTTSRFKIKKPGSSSKLGQSKKIYGHAKPEQN